MRDRNIFFILGSLFLLMLTSSRIHAQDPAYELRTISGVVSYLDQGIPDVNIAVEGSSRGTKTNANGEYSIRVRTGEKVIYSHVSYKQLSIIIEDVTQVINLELTAKINELETVVVTADGRSGKTLERAKKSQSGFNSSRGSFDPRTSGNAVSFIDGAETTPGARDILDVLIGKVAGVTVNRENNEVILRRLGSVNTEVPPIWDVDGVVINYIPSILPDDVKDIYILKSLASTNRYGTVGRGGVIVVRTKSGSFDPASVRNERIAEQYRNQDYYANDASIIDLYALGSHEYADALEEFNDKQEAKKYYEEKLKHEDLTYSARFAVAVKFATYFNDLTLASEIFTDIQELYRDNPEILKAIAYHLDMFGNFRESVNTYEQVFKLRPSYAQSYRDLANAYMENNEFKRAWRLYMSYVKQGNDISSEGIGEMIFNEMEWMFFLRSNQTGIKENFLPKNKNIDEFRSDIRITLEWNTSEAEFELEFVNPEKRSYVFDHSLAENEELITDEKLRGYSSKEFLIDDLQKGDWLVNLTYKGNKKPEPTYFKLTTYYNWGKPGQKKEIQVYPLSRERNKIQLKIFNGQSLTP